MPSDTCSRMRSNTFKYSPWAHSRIRSPPPPPSTDSASPSPSLPTLSFGLASSRAPGCFRSVGDARDCFHRGPRTRPRARREPLEASVGAGVHGSVGFGAAARRFVHHEARAAEGLEETKGGRVDRCWRVHHACAGVAIGGRVRAARKRRAIRGTRVLVDSARARFEIHVRERRAREDAAPCRLGATPEHRVASHADERVDPQYDEQVASHHRLKHVTRGATRRRGRRHPRAGRLRRGNRTTRRLRWRVEIRCRGSRLESRQRLAGIIRAGAARSRRGRSVGSAPFA